MQKYPYNYIMPYIEVYDGDGGGGGRVDFGLGSMSGGHIDYDQLFPRCRYHEIDMHRVQNLALHRYYCTAQMVLFQAGGARSLLAPERFWT